MTQYGLAKIDDARDQARKDNRRLRVKGLEWKFEPIQIPDMKAWLKENTLCRAPIATPEGLKDAIQDLERWLGNPNWKLTKKKNGFARVSTVRIKSKYSTSGPVRRTVYKLNERYDYFQGSEDQNVFVSVACADIVEHFLHASGYGSFLHAILNMKDETPGGYRVYAHVDWYPLRTYAAQTWHKDTRGSTLFVGLIYMNQDEIQGPDVISNPWPLGELEENRELKCVLPEWVKDPIDQILEENRSEAMMIRQTGKVPAGGGMVWFIDELIHHKTPGHSAKPNDIELAISEKTVGRLTGVQGPEQWDSDFSSKEPRKFVRIWVTLDKGGVD